MPEKLKQMKKKTSLKKRKKCPVKVCLTLGLILKHLKNSMTAYQSTKQNKLYMFSKTPNL